MVNDRAKSEEFSKWLSWKYIIIACIVFFPLGLVLLIRRIIIEENTAKSPGKAIIITGWVLVVMAALGLIMGISEGFEEGTILREIIFAVIGYSLIHLGIKRKKRAERFKKYISIIIHHDETSLHKIAELIPTTLTDVRRDLQNMINKGYLPGAYINDISAEIVIHKDVAYSHYSIPRPARKYQLEGVVVNCNGCGANNAIKRGKTGKCPYCGNVFSG